MMNLMYPHQREMGVSKFLRFAAFKYVGNLISVAAEMVGCRKFGNVLM